MNAKETPQWDQYRAGPESWPWLFGTQLRLANDANANGGIESNPQVVYDLAVLCAPFLKPKEWEEIEEAMAKPPTLVLLYRIKVICVNAAHRVNAWTFANQKPFDFVVKK